MPQHDLQWFLDRLEGVEGEGTQFQAWCPCHDDYGSSMKGLSISLNGKRVLMKCHSPHCGATLTEVLEVLQTGETSYNGNGHEEEIPVTVRKSGKQKTPKSKDRALKSSGGMAWWVNYTGVAENIWKGLGCVEHESGVAFTFAQTDVLKIRKPPKEIIWLPKSADTPPLWPMPEDELPEHVWIVEGESDNGVVNACGHYGFSVTKGAGTDLPATWAEELHKRGVEEVTICADWDKSGAEMKRELEKEVVDAGMACNVVHLELVLDPFTGANDLRSLWFHLDFDVDEMNKTLSRATQRVDLRYPILSYDELEEWAQTEVDWLIEDLLSPGDKVLISGPQKSYKTWIELDMARSLVQEGNFLCRAEWKVREAKNVLLVQEEGSKSAWARRIRRMGLTEEERGRFHTLHRQGIRFTDSSTIDTIIAVCRQESIDVLFLDPLQRMIPGVDENDSSATGVVWDEVFRIQYALPHLVVVVVHHANKTDRLTWESVRGSSRHAGEVDLGIFCQKHPLEDDTVRIAYDGRDIPNYLGTGESFEAKVYISGDDEGEHTFTVDAREVSVNVTNITHLAGSKNKDKVQTAIAEGHNTRRKIMDETGLSDSTVRAHLEALVEDGRIVETDRGEGRAKTYEIVEDDE